MKNQEEIEGITSMPTSTSTEVKVRTLKGDRTKDLEDERGGCFAFCRKFKFWRRRGRSAVPDLEDERQVTVAAADADHASQLTPATPGPDLVPVTVAEKESEAASDQTQTTGDLEGAASDMPKATGDLKGVPNAPDQATVPLEKEVPRTCRGPGFCRPCRLVVAVTRAQRRLVVGRQGGALRRLQEEYSGVRVTVPPPEDEKAEGVTLSGLRCQVEAAAQAIRNNLAEAEDRQRRAKMAKQARKNTAKVTVPVAPNRRGHVVGHGGEALRAILEDYKEVRVTVPRPQDTEAHGITVVGPKDQVSAVTAAIARRLEDVEARQKEIKMAKKAKKDRKKMTVAVAPSQRRHVVGHEGEALRSLQQQYEGVRVTVPPPEDKSTRHVTLQGPRDKVEAAAAVITRRLEEASQAKAAKAAKKTGPAAAHTHRCR